MRKLIVIAALILPVTGWLPPTTCEAQKANEVPTLSKAQWREDVQYLAKELPKRHMNAFHTVTREQFERAVAELDAAIPTLQDHQIIVRMWQIAAGIGDAHTRVRLPNSFRRYPLAVGWFGNELRVIRATADYKDALGARVIKIGDAEIGEVQRRIASIVSGAGNEWYVLFVSATLMIRPEVMHTLGFVPDAGRAAFTLENDRGKRFTLNVAAVPANTALELGVAAKVPLYLQQVNERFWFTYLADSQTVYVSFRGYANLGENARKLFEFVERNPTQKLVIDLRQNGGGDFYEGRRHLIARLQKLPAINRRGHLFVVIGRQTGSAAMANAIDFRKETNAILVGEPIGERPNNYSENDEFRLPHSGLEVSYSTRYYKFLEQDAPAVMPDKHIDRSWVHYLAGRDPVMEWILSYSE